MAFRSTLHQRVVGSSNQVAMRQLGAISNPRLQHGSLALDIARQTYEPLGHRERLELNNFAHNAATQVFQIPRKPVALSQGRIQSTGDVSLGPRAVKHFVAPAPHQQQQEDRYERSDAGTSTPATQNTHLGQHIERGHHSNTFEDVETTDLPLNATRLAQLEEEHARLDRAERRPPSSPIRSRVRRSMIHMEPEYLDGVIPKGLKDYVPTPYFSPWDRIKQRGRYVADQIRG